MPPPGQWETILSGSSTRQMRLLAPCLSTKLRWDAPGCQPIAVFLGRRRALGATRLCALLAGLRRPAARALSAPGQTTQPRGRPGVTRCLPVAAARLALSNAIAGEAAGRPFIPVKTTKDRHRYRTLSRRQGRRASTYEPLRRKRCWLKPLAGAVAAHPVVGRLRPQPQVLRGAVRLGHEAHRLALLSQPRHNGPGQVRLSGARQAREQQGVARQAVAHRVVHPVPPPLFGALRLHARRPAAQQRLRLFYAVDRRAVRVAQRLQRSQPLREALRQPPRRQAVRNRATCDCLIFICS